MAVVEECWTLVGDVRDGTWTARRVRHRNGQPATVTADGAWTLAREEEKGDAIGFVHTHPMGGLSPSRRDVRTMRAWCDALAKPLICVIETPGDIGAWRFDDYRSRGERLASVKRAGKTKIIGVEHDAGKVSPRTALPRERADGKGRRAARRALRRRGDRVQPRR